MTSSRYFMHFANWAAHATGHPLAFASAVLVVLIWATTGPIFGFSDTWQLVINTGTTIITFLMVFLIQSTQNRDNQAMQIKLDELIRSHEGAHNIMIDLEALSDDELQRIRKRYAELAQKALGAMKGGGKEIDTMAIDLHFPEIRSSPR